MPTEAAENEPSMEEILASIRRIIDEDDEEGGEAEAEVVAEAPVADAPVVEPTPEPEPVAEIAPEPEPEVEPAVEDEVLELTDMVEDIGGGTDPVALDDDLMIVDREEDDPIVELPAPEPEPVMEAAPEPEPAPEPVAVEDDSLVGAPAATAAGGAFHALAENLRVASADGMTFEAMVREMMRPMLKEWLDTNLPRIVEEKVESEIERIARRR